MKVCPALIALLLLGLTSSVESRQPLVGLIKGFVKNELGASIPYAGLTATNLDSIERVNQTTGTDRQGFYQFVNVPPGRYSIIARMKGYCDYKISWVTLYPGEVLTLPEISMSFV
jgi:hypothetical protein